MHLLAVHCGGLRGTTVPRSLHLVACRPLGFDRHVTVRRGPSHVQSHPPRRLQAARINQAQDSPQGLPYATITPPRRLQAARINQAQDSPQGLPCVQINPCGRSRGVRGWRSDPSCRRYSRRWRAPGRRNRRAGIRQPAAGDHPETRRTDPARCAAPCRSCA